MPTTKLPLTAKNEGERTVIRIGSLEIGKDLIVIAGPCSVESEAQLLETAHAVKAAGANILRGGAFKPRTSPYEFQGLGLKALALLRKAKMETGLPAITEVLDSKDVPLVSEYVDLLQIGSRNMHNTSLLKAVGKTKMPVVLKRGMSATLVEWLGSAEYILQGGNPNVILCERGIRTFEAYTRNTLDLSAVPAIRQLSHLPIFIDPSHAAGQPQLVPALSLAAIAAGAHGLIIEVHCNPAEALSDKDQQLTPEQFSALMPQIKRMGRFMKDVPSLPPGDAFPPIQAGSKRFPEVPA